MQVLYAKSSQYPEIFNGFHIWISQMNSDFMKFTLIIFIGSDYYQFIELLQYTELRKSIMCVMIAVDCNNTVIIDEFSPSFGR